VDTDDISLIELDSDGRLRIYPRVLEFPLIYRPGWRLTGTMPRATFIRHRAVYGHIRGGFGKSLKRLDNRDFSYE
jgi:hypothetical protein